MSASVDRCRKDDGQRLGEGFPAGCRRPVGALVRLPVRPVARTSDLDN